MAKRLVIGITGASGIIYGIRFLEIIKELKLESHLIISDDALLVLKSETEFDEAYVKSLANKVYSNKDLAAPISSGSFKTDGMVIIPCSMKTLASIALGISDTLISRAALVTLKEKRTLVLVPRETPLSMIHIEAMLKASQAGAIILPAMPGFYHRPKTIDDLIKHIIGKVLDILGVEHSLFKRWGEA